VENSTSEDDTQLQSAMEYMNIQPGTKSKTSIARTPGAKPIDFDPIATALRGVRNTGLDYYLSNELSTSRQALSENIKIVDQNPEVKEIATDLKKIYNEAVGNVIGSTMSTNVVGGRILDVSRRIGYYSTLASIPRAGAELLSNLAFTSMSNPLESYAGITKYSKYSFNEAGRLVVQNTGAETGTKLYNDEQLGGSKADQQGVQRGKTQTKRTVSEASVIGDKLSRYVFLDKVGRGVEKIGEYLISTPDQMISRPLWFGSFAREFKAQTGNEVDFEKIAANDTDYMEKNSDAIKKARQKADVNVTRAATNNSPFSGVLKNQISDQDGAMRNWYRTMNAYMSRFSLNEYATARQAIASMVGKGQMSQIQGAGTLAGVLTRMSMYVMLYRGLSKMFFGLMGVGDEEDENEEELSTTITRQTVGAAVSLLSRGMSGNVPMYIPNMGIEQINEEYGYEFGLRDTEEFNPYTQSLIFSAMNKDAFNRNPYKQIIINVSGPFMPQTKAIMRQLEAFQRSQNNKTQESREKNLKELISLQTALEWGNAFGKVPFYRDIRAGLMAEKYKKEPDEIQPFNLKELKEFDPKGYEKLMKEQERIKNSPKYKKQEAQLKKQEAQLKKQEERLNR